MPFHLIGVDASSVNDQHGRRPIEAYEAIEGRVVTLTRREADLIALAHPGASPPDALEELYPWLPDCHFLNDSEASLLAAEKIFRRYEQHFVSATTFCDTKWNTICNTLRQNSTHDARFYSAWHLPIQDVYVLEEVRPERTVVAIDFNGMYPSCMQNEFPKPSALRFVEFGRNLDPREELLPGLYRCVLSQPNTDFIARHNPFRSFHSGRHLRARVDEPIAIDLNEFEIAYFSKHFRRIHLVEAVIANETIAHPLAKEARRSFARRKNYVNQNNKALADKEKFLATLMTSCANRPTRSRRTFSDASSAMAYVKLNFGIDIPSDEPISASDIWLDGRKGVTLRYTKSGVEVRGPTLGDGSACYLLGQRIVARGRIRLLELMELVLSCAPAVEICYANIDSIHFSLPSDHRAAVLGWLEREASEAMGSFKIEAVTNHGLWLEPGRYWLYSGNEISKFRNRSIGDRNSPFKEHSIHVANKLVGDLHVPIRITLDMQSTMSPSWSLDKNDCDSLALQTMLEVGDGTKFSEVLDGLERNRREAIPARLSAFLQLRETMSSSRHAASGREELP